MNFQSKGYCSDYRIKNWASRKVYSGNRNLAYEPLIVVPFDVLNF